MEDSPRLSKSVRSLVQLKDILIRFMQCELGNGQDAMFWFDSWTSLGPLLTYVGETGPRRLRLRLSASVADATRNGGWNLPSARSPQIESLQILMTTIPVPDVSFGKDKYLWIQMDGSFGSTFSSKAIWKHIREQSPLQPWSKTIWFKEQILRNSFISWLVMLRRLPTRDRLRRWGMNVPELCVLCNYGVETHHHLFFECDYSTAVWMFFASRIWPNPPLDVHSAAAWIGVS